MSAPSAVPGAGSTGTTASASAGSGNGPDWVALLRPWQQAQILSRADLHIADRLATLAGLAAEQFDVVLAVALANRAPRNGHVCLDLHTVAASARAETDGVRYDDLALRQQLLDSLPTASDAIEQWRAVIAASPLVSLEGDLSADAISRPLVLHGDLLYLQRYRDLEARIAQQVLQRSASAGASPLAPRAEQLLEQMQLSAEQRAAVGRGLDRSFSVIVGGPGTGKTHTVAALLAVLLDSDPDLRIALAAPTGKASARMGEAIASAAALVRELPLDGAAVLADRLLDAEPRTIHRLLGYRPGSVGFRHHSDNPLPHDVVIIDETSMVSLPLLARLLDAVAPSARIVLVGDPGQLASVEAGSVLGDIAGPVVAAASSGEPLPQSSVSECISVLLESRRFPSESPVGRFAAAVRVGDSDTALEVLQAGRLDAPQPDAAPADIAGVTIAWHPASVLEASAVAIIRTEAFGAAERVRDCAEATDSVGALDAIADARLLCAHRHGPYGVSRWNHQFDEWLGLGGHAGRSPVGRPVMVTVNDPANDLFNGDLGVLVATADGPMRVAFPGSNGVRLLSPARIENLDTVHAMTIHKSQGSEFHTVVVVLPAADSPLATRELLYTAVTRARHRVVIIGGAEAVAAAIATGVQRASGLAERIWS